MSNENKLNISFRRTSRHVAQKTLPGMLRTRSARYLILIYCLLLLSLFLFVACGSQANSPSTNVNPDVKAITDTLSAYCNAITNHDNQKTGEFVRQYLGQHYTPAVSLTILHSIQVRYKDVTGCTVGPVTLSADGQMATGRVSYTQANGEVLNVDYKLTKSNGTWTLAVS